MLLRSVFRRTRQARELGHNLQGVLTRLGSLTSYLYLLLISNESTYDYHCYYINALLHTKRGPILEIATSCHFLASLGLIIDAVDTKREAGHFYYQLLLLLIILSSRI